MKLGVTLGSNLTRTIEPGVGLEPIAWCGDSDDEIHGFAVIRQPPLENKQLTIEFLPEDQIWVDWISAVLTAGGFSITERRLRENGRADDAEIACRQVLVWPGPADATYSAWRRRRASAVIRPSRPQADSVELQSVQPAQRSGLQERRGSR